MQGAQAEPDSAVSLMRTFWVCKLRLATLQAIGVPKAVLTSDSDLDWRAVERKLEEHRQFRPIDQLVNAEHTRQAALLDARFAEAGLEALKGLYEESLDICDELLTDNDSHLGPSSVTQKIRALGVKGLVLAQKDEWEAAKNFLLRSVELGLEQSGSCGNFFHDYVVDLFGEALGFLLTHVVVATNTDGTRRLKQVGIPGNCQNNHAYYPFLLLGLGVLGGEGAQHQRRGSSADQSRMYLECARLVSPWPEATCVCFNAYGMATMAAIESKDMDNVRTTMAQSIQLAESLGTVHVLTILFQSLLLADSLDLATEPPGCMAHLMSSLFKRLGDMDFDNGCFHRALQSYNRALRSQLRVREMVGDSEIQSTCEQIRKSISQGVAKNDINNYVQANDFARRFFSGPPADANAVDVMVHSFCVLAHTVYCYESQRIPSNQIVADVISEAQLRGDVVHDEEWIELCLDRVLVEEYVRSKAYDKAAEVCVIQSRLKTDLEERLGKLSFAGNYWSMAGQLGKGIEVFRELMDESAGLTDFQWRTKVRIYLVAATLFYRDGQLDNAIEAREKAWNFCTRLGSYEYSDEDIAKGMTHLLKNYMDQNNWSQACKLVDSVDAHIYKHLERTTTWEEWQSCKYRLARHRDVGSRGKMDFQLQDIMASFIPTENLPEEDQTPFLPRIQNPNLKVSEGCAVVSQVQNRYRLIEGHLRTRTKRKRWAALKLIDEILELLQKLPPSLGLPESISCYFDRSSIFRSLGEKTRAHEEFEKAIAFFKVVEEHGDLRSGAYKRVADILCLQAVAAVKCRAIEESERLIVLLVDSKTLVSRDALHHPMFHYHRACVFELQGLWKEAAAKAREAALLGVAEQRRKCSLDHEPVSWLKYYGFEGLKDIFWSLEDLYTLNLKTPQIALLWAERSRLRFLMHQIHSQPTESAIPSPSHFDLCDQLLFSVIDQTMKALPSKTAIIEYSYNPVAQAIHMYVITKAWCLVSFRHCILRHWFEDAGLPYNTSLEGLIEDAIGEEDPEDNLNALGILHSLLVGFIEDELEGCDSLIFSPSHGCLAKIPFAALYDNTHKEHLIVKRSVSTVPSIVMLYRCLYNQYKFEANLEFLSPLLQVPSLEPESSHGVDQANYEFDGQFPRKVAFIAGNPVPMGLGLNQLPGAEKEARDVARLFGIKPCVGTDMTKQAVLEGLSNSKVVLLATHGKVDDDYPHGCLVLQAAPRPGKVTPDLKGKGLAQEQDCDVQERDGHLEDINNVRDWRLFEFTDKYSKQKRDEEAPQILTAGEIATLEGGISTGLVVLSACESGLGESTFGEGLLGLGRALLQAGAVTAILTLWKVNDTFTCDFVTKLFKELLSVESEGKSVSECLRTVMLFMIHHNHPIKHWAPFTIIGSPILQLLKPEKSWSVSSGLHECSAPVSVDWGHFAFLR